jgi:hypothetical protein
MSKRGERRLLHVPVSPIESSGILWLRYLNTAARKPFGPIKNPFVESGEHARAAGFAKR